MTACHSIPSLAQSSLPPDDAQRCKAKQINVSRKHRGRESGCVSYQSLWRAALCAGRGRNKEERLSKFCYYSGHPVGRPGICILMMCLGGRESRAVVLSSLPASRTAVVVFQDRVGFLKLRCASLTAFIEGTIVDFQSESSKQPPESIPRSCVSRALFPLWACPARPLPAVIRHK